MRYTDNFNGGKQFYFERQQQHAKYKHVKQRMDVQHYSLQRCNFSNHCIMSQSYERRGVKEERMREEEKGMREDENTPLLSVKSNFSYLYLSGNTL